MKQTKLVQVGDIITSKHFANIEAVIEETDMLRGGHYRVTENKAYAIDFFANNEKARYVVERTSLTGGGTGGMPGDIYPNGWNVLARQLSPHDTYNPLGQLIEFYQSGFFICQVKDLEAVGKMKMTFKKIKSSQEVTK